MRCFVGGRRCFCSNFGKVERIYTQNLRFSQCSSISRSCFLQRVRMEEDDKQILFNLIFYWPARRLLRVLWDSFCKLLLLLKEWHRRISHFKYSKSRCCSFQRALRRFHSKTLIFSHFLFTGVTDTEYFIYSRAIFQVLFMKSWMVSSSELWVNAEKWIRNP